MMLVTQKLTQFLAVMVIVVLSFALCQEDERRAVAEHQFMNDRGRAVQSLKRLLWVFNTVKGLHTAQVRTPQLEPDPTDGWAEAPQQRLSQEETGVKHGTLGSLLQILWRAVHKPQLASLPESDE